MLQKLRRPLVVLLVFIMLVSLFAAVPVTANADTAFESVDQTKYYQVINGSYYTKDYVGENVSVIASSVIVESDENGWYLKPDEGGEVKALKG